MVGDPSRIPPQPSIFTDGSGTKPNGAPRAYDQPAPTFPGSGQPALDYTQIQTNNYGGGYPPPSDNPPPYPPPSDGQPPGRYPEQPGVPPQPPITEEPPYVPPQPPPPEQPPEQPPYTPPPPPPQQPPEQPPYTPPDKPPKSKPPKNRPPRYEAPPPPQYRPPTGTPGAAPEAFGGWASLHNDPILQDDDGSHFEFKETGYFNIVNERDNNGYELIANVELAAPNETDKQRQVLNGSLAKNSVVRAGGHTLEITTDGGLKLDGQQKDDGRFDLGNGYVVERGDGKITLTTPKSKLEYVAANKGSNLDVTYTRLAGVGGGEQEPGGLIGSLVDRDKDPVGNIKGDSNNYRVADLWASPSDAARNPFVPESTGGSVEFPMDQKRNFVRQLYFHYLKWDPAPDDPSKPRDEQGLQGWVNALNGNSMEEMNRSMLNVENGIRAAAGLPPVDHVTVGEWGGQAT